MIDRKEPFVALTTGQSNFEMVRPYRWEVPPNVGIWDWNGDERHIGAGFIPPPEDRINTTWSFGAELGRQMPDSPVRVINISRPATPIDRWTHGTVFQWAGGGGQPELGEVRVNRPSFGDITEIYVSDVAPSGGGKTRTFMSIRLGDRITITTDDHREWIFTSAGTATRTGDSWTIPVVPVSRIGDMSGPVRLAIAPDMMDAIKRNVPAALEKAGANKINLFACWHGEADARHNNGAAYFAEREAVHAELAAQPWWSPETDIIVCGIVSEKISGAKSKRLMNETLRRISAVDTQRRMFFNPAVLGPTYWEAAGKVHWTADASYFGGRIMANNYLNFIRFRGVGPRRDISAWRRAKSRIRRVLGV